MSGDTEVAADDGFAFEALGDGAWLLRFGDRIDAGINDRVLVAALALQHETPAWLHDVVPAYASLALHFDADAFEDARQARAEVAAWVRTRLRGNAEITSPRTPRRVVIPVRYGGEAGPDLLDVAAHAGLDPDAVVARHAGAHYRVAMLGFAPGFPYLLGLDPALATPRLAKPRLHVDAGSVAIGGAQTGIYPRAGAGGWRVIGRTDAVLFDPARTEPSLLQPGDVVRFVDARLRR